MTDIKRQIVVDTLWLREEPDLIAARLAFLLRQRGIHPKRVVCARIFPDTAAPESIVVITPDRNVYQFGFNGAGMRAEQAVMDAWTDLTPNYQDHQWRDEILMGLHILDEMNSPAGG